MKKILLFLILICSISGLKATDYYVDSSVTDTNVGSATPDFTAYNPTTFATTGGSASVYKTLDDVNAKTFLPSDTLYFRKGQSWYGTISLRGSVVDLVTVTLGGIKSFGTGSNPIITGFKRVSSWVDQGGNIWESSDTVTSYTYVRIVTVDGVNKAMGREPEVGFVYDVDTHVDSTQITSASMGSATNWSTSTGQLVKRAVHWEWSVNDIVSQSGNTVTYSNTINSSYDVPYDDSGFFIQNDIRTLDTAGEWYFNSTTKKISVYSIGEPVNVKVSARDRGLKSHTGSGLRSNVKVDGITFDGYNDHGFFMNNFDNVSVQNCTFNHCGIAGIFVQQTDYYTINNCSIKNSGIVGIYSFGTTKNTYGTIINNVIDSTSLILGLGYQYISAGISENANEVTIKNNVITNNGYHGIYVYSMNGLVQNNYVNNSLLLYSDGGGIYTAIESTNLRIDGNVILNSHGYALGNHFGYLGARGIYLDRQTSHVSVINNTTAYCYEGIYVSVGADHTIVSGNTAFENSSANIHFNDDVITYPTFINELNTLTNNVFVSVTPTYRIASFTAKSNRIPSFLSTASGNVYARPLDDNLTFYVAQPNTMGDTASTSFTLAEWKTFSSVDENSTKSPKVISSESDLMFKYNETNLPKVVTNPFPGMGMNGITRYAESFTLQPYTSVIVIKDLLNPTGENKQSKSYLGKPLKSSSGLPIYTN